MIICSSDIKSRSSPVPKRQERMNEPSKKTIQPSGSSPWCIQILPIADKLHLWLPLEGQLKHHNSHHKVSERKTPLPSPSSQILIDGCKKNSGVKLIEGCKAPFIHGSVINLSGMLSHTHNFSSKGTGSTQFDVCHFRELYWILQTEWCNSVTPRQFGFSFATQWHLQRTCSTNFIHWPPEFSFLLFFPAILTSCFWLIK